ncbi:MAG: HigA family addiction module antidote protein [Mediterranea sp.]|jgi:addiction module HigA family antidote|nr:HigA family addiction module antidote protein [Mediterranea sp.]
MGNLGNGFCPTHPGEVLKDEVEYRKISQKELAKKMGMSYHVLNDILNEHRPITASTAMMFEAALNIPADTLMRLQLKYNMAMANQDKRLAKKLVEIRKLTASLL